MVFLPMDPIFPRFDWIHHPDKVHYKDYLMQLNINPHNGTHVDTPRHFPGQTPIYQTSIDKVPLDDLIGPARVIEIKSKVSIEPQELEPYDIQAGERILFKTINSTYYKKGKFVDNYVYVSVPAAKYLVERGVIVVGLDYLAIGGPYGDFEGLAGTHIAFMDNGIWIIEVLDLSTVKAGRYEMVCLPLNIKGGDAAPARIILKPLEDK
jgi:arylformamidase